MTNGTCSCMAGRGRVILAAGGQGGDSRGSIPVPWGRPRVPQVVGRSGSSRTGVVRWLPHRLDCVPTRSTPPAGSAKPVQQMPVAEAADAVPEMIAYGQAAAGMSWTSSTGRPPVALDRERQVRKSTGTSSSPRSGTISGGPAAPGRGRRRRPSVARAAPGRRWRRPAAGASTTRPMPAYSTVACQRSRIGRRCAGGPSHGGHGVCQGVRTSLRSGRPPPRKGYDERCRDSGQIGLSVFIVHSAWGA